MATLDVRLDCPVTNSSFMPFDSTIWRSAPKMAAIGPEWGKPRTARSWPTLVKSEFRGHLVHPELPTFPTLRSTQPNVNPPPPPFPSRLIRGDQGAACSLGAPLPRVLLGQ